MRHSGGDMANMNFEQCFGIPPAATVSAPGRVNLLGEHTDYNAGFVLPTAIPQRTYVQIAHSRDDKYRIYAKNLNEYQEYETMQSPLSGFMAYIGGCINVLNKNFPTQTPVSLFISSDVPIGCGLSSSAALEVAVLRAYRELFQLPLDDISIAQMAQQAEIEYAQVRVGIMDQMASSLADTEHMLFIDTRDLNRELLPLPEGASVIVLDSGVPRQLVGSVYNQRRAECEHAATLLGVKNLREVDDPTCAASLPSPLAQRARHVISENNRVLEAKRGICAQHFGELMNASHTSLRDDYQVSITALDVLSDLMQKTPQVYGARLTGAGFGGACVGLVQTEFQMQAAIQILTAYQARGYQAGRIIVPPLS